MIIKFLSVTWDLRIVLAAIWAFIGMCIMGGSFMLDVMPWWAVCIYIIIALSYIATQESVFTKLTSTIDSDL